MLLGNYVRINFDENGLGTLVKKLVSHSFERSLFMKTFHTGTNSTVNLVLTYHKSQEIHLIDCVGPLLNKTSAVAPFMLFS